MTWYHSLASAALVVCLISLSYHFTRLLRLGPPKDFSVRRGNLKPAIIYSFLGAMNPRKKESAYLHLPTYAAGLFYHAGTFTSIVLYFLFFFNFHIEGSLRWGIISLLAVSGACGIGILAKRTAVRRLRHLSNLDDYVANILVTLFQFLTLALLVKEVFAPFYFLCVSLLLLYLPFGKLKHALYFFAARYHLGLFYGWRGVWPLRKS
jgi:hypothetical protein